jgi:tetratricopeptide (TPR) repeat protein
VRVDVGHVLVRSPELPGGSRPLAAGEVLRLGAPEPAAPAVEPHAGGGATAAAARVEQRRRRAEPTRAATSEAAAPPPRPRLGKATAAASLWEQADQARQSGQPARAAALLARLVERSPEDSQVALAAFTLGVLQLDRLERPVEAAESFQLALELGIAAALRDDAYLRWAEALSRARDQARLRMVSAEYARLYPRGRHRAAIERLARAGEDPSPLTPLRPP